MTVGTDDEARLADLADDVHRARKAEAHRRIQRHRARAVLILVALVALVALAVLVVVAVGARSPSERSSSGAPDRPAALPARAKATTTSPATTPTRDPRPATAPPVGTVPDPAARLVLVDRQRTLPSGWAPSGMVTPRTSWATTDAVERRLLRPDAAAALDRLSAAAQREGVPIIGISAFRSDESQRQVYESYVRKEGTEAANRFSAAPGHSEHQTGLAVDVTGADGSCPTEPCFAFTPQAAWLEEHAPEHGFIVRYPKGKELVTTYTAEPWHLRYVGIGPALAMQRAGLTLEEYLRAA